MKHLEHDKDYKKASGFFHKEYRTVRPALPPAQKQEQAR